MSNQLAIYKFPDAYSTLVNNYTGTIKYISSTGSNSNNGNDVSTPYLTVDYAYTQTSATTRVMFVILEGTYTMTAVSNGNSVALRDGGNERVFVGCPGKTIIQWTASTGDRDAPMVQFTNTASAMYGIIAKRNNNGRTTNYMTAFFKGIAKGNLYNCVFSETNSGNLWSYQYDNYAENNISIRNCTFYNGAAPAGNYTNAGVCLTIDSVFNTTCTTGGTETNVLKSQTVNSTTYVTTGVTTAGVYSGTYAWNGTTTLPATSINATGGTVTTYTVNGTYIKQHTFTASGSFVVSSANAGDTIYYITVGGGGGGTYNNYVGSGGGGAQVTYGTGVVSAGTYTVTVGSGGTAKSTSSYGGGGTGGSTSISGTGISVSSLGGPGSGMNGNPDATGTYTYGTSTAYIGAGAGGAGGAGNVGTGGIGKLITSGLFSTNTVYYGGGGAGGVTNGNPTQLGGTGGGANATLAGGGQPATLNSGGGGAGGSAMQGTAPSSGADGIVIIAYATTQPNGIYPSVLSAPAGSNVTFTLKTSSTGNVPYTITGITSDIINNSALTGNFVVSAGFGNVTFAVKSVLTSTYTMSLAAESYTANVSITPNVSITTAVTGIGYTTNTSSLINPINGQLNIPDMLVTPTDFSLLTKSAGIAGQMNIPDMVTTVTDLTLNTKPLLPSFGNLQSNTILPYTTITTTTAGSIDQGIIKLFGDNPNREYWI